MAYKNKADAVKYNNEYNAKKYDRITIVVPKGNKEIIQDAAECNGESVNAFINRLIEQELKRTGRSFGFIDSGKD